MARALSGWPGRAPWRASWRTFWWTSWWPFWRRSGRVWRRVISFLQFEASGLPFEVEGQAWTCYPKALVLLHKPAGYECSQKPKHWPSVLLLLPPPLRQRGVQPVGRLDQDTTGLLLLTDDGTLIHRLTSPKHQIGRAHV